MQHYPVMLREVLSSIRKMNWLRKFTVADCNFGLGGHSNAILKEFPQATMLHLSQHLEQDMKSIKKFYNFTKKPLPSIAGINPDSQ